MSYFAAEVIEIPPLENHPWADSLSVVHLDKPYKLTVVCRTEDWIGKEKAVYIPVDAVAPATPEFEFLGENRRIKARKLRGIFSMGMLYPAKDEWEIGQDVTKELGIEKYDDTLDNANRNRDLQVSRSPSGDVKYTDIENLRKYWKLLKDGEEVVVTEKIHGANFRAVFQDNQLFVGSHRNWLKEGNNDWWNAAFQAGLPAFLSTFPNKIFFGEVYGQVQDLTYGTDGTLGLRFFDIFDIAQQQYLNFEVFKDTIFSAQLDMVPIIHHGPWPGFEASLSWAEGSTLAALGTHINKKGKCKGSMIKEGFVVKPAVERWDERVGRVILKLHSEAFLTRGQ